MLSHENKKATARLIGTVTEPRIIFTLKVIATMEYIVSKVSTEVGWLGLVDKISDHVYLVKEIFLPPQEVNGGTCELTGDGLFALYEKLIEDGREADADKIRFWGHSHANGGVGPSGQDEEQAIEMLKNNQDYLIRAIANKSGHMAVTYFNMPKSIAVDNVNWYTDDGIDRKEIADTFEPLIKDNIKTLSYSTNTRVNDRRSYVPPAGSYPYHGGGYYDEQGAYQPPNSRAPLLGDWHRQSKKKNGNGSKHGRKTTFNLKNSTKSGK